MLGIDTPMAKGEDSYKGGVGDKVRNISWDLES